MRPGQMNRNRNKSERIFQSICHWCEREDSMEIDAGGAGLRREAMEATPQRAHTASAKRHRSELIWKATRNTEKITEKCSRTQRLHGNRAKPGRDDAMRGIQGARAGS